MNKYDYLRVYQPYAKKQRIGRQHDGGYVICDIGNDYDIFISGGISNDISFEMHLMEVYPNLQCVAFDGTIDNLPKIPLIYGEDQWVPVKDFPNEWIQISNSYHFYGKSHIQYHGVPKWSNTRDNPMNRKYIAIMDPELKLVENPSVLTWNEAISKYDNLASSDDILNYHKIKFYKKNLGKENSENMSNLRDYFDKYHNIFLKLDIEGGENDLFDSLSDDDLLKIKQLVIEFHSADQIKIPKRLEKTHWLVHYHGNNHEGVVIRDGVELPMVFECTYIRKNKNEFLPYNSKMIPDKIVDFPNNPNNNEIILNKYPYVTEKIIPRVIYTINLDGSDEKVNDFCDSLRKENPSFRVVNFNNNKLDEFIKSNYTNEIYNLFINLKNNKLKINLSSYLIIYYFGGIYHEYNSKIISYNKLVGGGESIITRLPEKGHFSNKTFIFERGNYFLKRCIDLCIENIISLYTENENINYISGSSLFTRVLNEFMFKYSSLLNNVNCYYETDDNINKVLSNTQLMCKVRGINFE
jgi:hypothetical protein